MDFGNLLGAYGQGWLYFGHLSFVLSVLAGMLSGIIIGIIPAIGAPVLLAMFLPFLFKLNPEQALPFMVAAYAVAFTGGALTTVVIGVPGTSANAVTLLDGYSMTKRGEVGRALGLAITSSGMGSLYSCVFALAMIPVVIPLVMAIASPEMVFLVLMGISMIAVLSRGSTIKGIISGLLGILVSLVGYQLVTGMERFTLGILYLREGLPVVPVFIGLFALPAMFSLSASGGTIAQIGKVAGVRDMLGGIKEVFTYARVNVISSVIGYIVGIIPGIGGLVASWVAYGQAKQTSKRADQFGTGVPEGVVAPESANNASAGGALLTTLTLGIPGSEACVLILAAFLITGIIPGREMVTTHLPFSISLLLVVGVTGVLAAVICILFAPFLSKIVTIPGNILVPLVITLIVVPVYASQEMVGDLAVLFVFGLIGWAMERFKYNLPSFVLGFILGSLFEKYLFLSLSAWGPLFFLRPISLGIIAVTAGLMAIAPITKRLDRASQEKVAQP